MTNKDKFLRDGVDVEEFVSEFEEYYDTNAENYIGTKIDFLKAFLREPIKPTLTKEEKVILKNINYTFNAIRRNNYGFLELYDICLGEWKECQFRDDLFRFIKEREEYLIKELLKND